MYIHIRFSQHGFVTLIPNVKRSIMLLEKVTPAGSETLGVRMHVGSLTSCNMSRCTPQIQCNGGGMCHGCINTCRCCCSCKTPRPFARAVCRRPTQIFVLHHLSPSPASALCPSDASHTSHDAAVKNPKPNPSGQVPMVPPIKPSISMRETIVQHSCVWPSQPVSGVGDAGQQDRKARGW